MSISRADLQQGVPQTLQNAQAGNSNGNGADVDANGAVDLRGVTNFNVDITAAGFTGTVNFEGSIDGTNFFPVGLKTMADGAAVTTATAAGAFKAPVDVPPLLRFRARTSGVSAGNVTVKLRKARNGG